MTDHDLKIFDRILFALLGVSVCAAGAVVAWLIAEGALR